MLWMLILVLIILCLILLYNSSCHEGYRDTQLFLKYPHMRKYWYPYSNYSIYDADANLLGYPYYNKAY